MSLSDHNSSTEWRILWRSGQTTVGFTAREQAEQVLGRKTISGVIQSRSVTQWEPLALDEEQAK